MSGQWLLKHGLVLWCVPSVAVVLGLAVADQKEWAGIATMVSAVALDAYWYWAGGQLPPSDKE